MTHALSAARPASLSPAGRPALRRALPPLVPFAFFALLRCCSDGFGTVIDEDGDGHASAESTAGCATWPHGADCDDSDPTIHPLADDVVRDGIDQNCDGVDGLATGEDGGVAADGGPPDAGAEERDAGQSSGADCSFNDDCPAQERCECDETTGCFCRLGARGTGVSGVDACSDGNDCASALCVEGNGGAYYCSGECEDAADCGPQLPVCADIAFVGRICIRDAS